MTSANRRWGHRVPRGSGGVGRWALLPVACAAVLLAGAATGTAVAEANAKRGLVTGFGGLRSVDEVELDEVQAAGGEVVRLSASWAAVAPHEPARARDPADPAYDFTRVDASVREARARGLLVLLLIGGAPSWAEGEGRPPVGAKAPAGTWKPRPGPARDFGEAIARRYSGSFPDPGAPGTTLPRVRHFQIFNEPNLPTYLTPQWNGRRAASPGIYRRLLNAFYRGIKSVQSVNVVVTGGTAPYGDQPGVRRARPVRFWRAVMCLRPNLRRARCPTRARFDVLAHHPINTSGGPFRSALHPDDASSPDMWKLRRVLRAAERRRTVRPRGRRPLWATEFWWDTDPPSSPPVGLRKQARWIAESLYLYWRGGASLALSHTVRDAGSPAGRASTAGVYLPDGTPKPAFRSFRFPFVARRHGRRVELWGKAPERGAVVIRRKRGPGRWSRVTGVRSGANRVFRAWVRLRGKPRLQARVRGGERSLAYRVR